MREDRRWLSLLSLRSLRALREMDIPVVAGISDTELGQQVVAAVVLKAGVETTEDSLKQALQDTLSSYKVPRNIVFIEHSDIPRTSTGKVKLFEMVAMISQRLSSHLTVERFFPNLIY